MPDDLTARRTARTMRGVTACGPDGAMAADDMHPDDLATIDEFKAHLMGKPAREEER